MKIRKIGKTAFFCLAIAMLFCIGCKAKGEKTFTLKMSTQLNESNPMVEGFKEWAKAVDAKTNGKLKITVYPSAQLGSDEDVIEQALQGVNVAVLTDGGRMANYVKDIGIIGMPYIADSYAELRAITEAPTFQTWIKQLADQDGIRLLSFNWYDGPRHFLTNVPVKTPDDLKGLRIRTPGAPVWAKSVEAMGATPIAMGWNDVYNSVQSKSIDGAEGQHTATFGARLFEVIKYIDKTAHFQLANAIIVGETWYQTLPEEYQTILYNECKAAAYSNADTIEKAADEYERQMIDKGMIVVEADREAFKKAADSAYTTLGFVELRDKLYGEIGKNQ